MQGSLAMFERQQALTAAIATLFGGVGCWVCKKLRGSKVKKDEEEESNLIEWREPRMGLVLRYDEKLMLMRHPIHRRVPFAVIEFDLVAEENLESAIGAAITVQVHDITDTKHTTLKEYVTQSLEALEELEDEALDISDFHETEISHQPALQFCYNCVDGDGVIRKVLSTVTSYQNAVYSISYSSPASSFSSLELVQQFTSDIEFTPLADSNSALIFTDPKHGVTLQVPVSLYHVESTPATGGRSWREIVQFSTVERPEGGASILRLDAEPADLPVIDVGESSGFVSPPSSDRRRKSTVASLRYAAQLYRQQVLQDMQNPDDILWARFDVNEMPDGTQILVPNEKGRRVSTDIVSSFTRSLVLRGPESLDAVTFCYYKACANNTTLCFIVYMWLHLGTLFVLSAVCHSDERISVAKSIHDVVNGMKYGEKHGQTSCLQYYSPAHNFSLVLPTELRVFEPFIGDPYVVFCLPSSSRLLHGPDTEKRGKLLREFYIQVRVLDAAEGGNDLHETLVSEMTELAGQEAIFHSSALTYLASEPALQIVFTSESEPYQGCKDLAMPSPGKATILRMITFRNHQKFLIEFVASVNYFPLLVDTVFTDILKSVTFEVK
eukprot:TRINITY_DN650_c3_g1_i1.p1 TRINITY_DN650_c3_g1~~TRINITY_DN650_c3_g1_i1.p1  ORF type:complete len:610 (+),score=90.65 TRINITY_DN650_c3_g1_i1:103-1932(+)